jgi:hypothetical protein
MNAEIMLAVINPWEWITEAMKLGEIQFVVHRKKIANISIFVDEITAAMRQSCRMRGSTRAEAQPSCRHQRHPIPRPGTTGKLDVFVS